MSYREQLRQARCLLEREIQELHKNLIAKERDLKKLEGLLKDKGAKRGDEGSLTSQIVQALYLLAKEQDTGVPARTVVQEFIQQRDDVNESTIRSTLYQVTRKMRPTEIAVGEDIKLVKVLKEGPLYNVELISEQEAKLV
ncbi:MAG: hypothetical protein QM401_08940 [Bacillota bacterium]|nr:hypothetical protein [Bacillota bacterium]HHU62579.1 hypothetical protein [Natronincola sp.]